MWIQRLYPHTRKHTCCCEKLRLNCGVCPHLSKDLLYPLFILFSLPAYSNISCAKRCVLGAAVLKRWSRFCSLIYLHSHVNNSTWRHVSFKILLRWLSCKLWCSKDSWSKLQSLRHVYICDDKLLSLRLLYYLQHSTGSWCLQAVVDLGWINHRLNESMWVLHVWCVMWTLFTAVKVTCMVMEI